MQVDSFYSSIQANHEGFYPVGQLSDLPVFCRPVLKHGNASLALWIDGWVVQATGDFAADTETGRRYAELAVAYARSKNSASFIELVLSDINIKTFIGETPLSGIEYGFFSRIAQIAYCGSMN
jgi:hypothetical protein